MRIDDEAAMTFYQASWAALLLRGLTNDDFDRRMLVLDLLAADETDDHVIPADLLDRIDGVEERAAAEPRPDGESSIEVISAGEGEGDERSGGRSPPEGGEQVQVPPPRPPPFVRFIPRGVLSQAWDFHPHDVDFWPSIPHGHLNGRPLPKLNPYVGRAFEGHDREVIKLRLTKKEMVGLWNFDKFREICLQAIDFYSTTYPDYQFPVSNPRNLPRPWLRYRRWRRYL